MKAPVAIGLVELSWLVRLFERQLLGVVAELVFNLITCFGDKALNLLLQSLLVAEVAVRQFHFERNVHAFGAVILVARYLLVESCVDFDHGSIWCSCGESADTQ